MVPIQRRIESTLSLIVKMRIVDGEAMGIILILSGQMSYSSHGTRMTGCRRVCVRLRMD